MLQGTPLWIALLGGVALVLYCLDQLALWMESSGWIYYRRTKKHTGATLGDAFLEVQAIVEPEVQHAVEERRQIKLEEADSGDPPQAGPGDATPLSEGAPSRAPNRAEDAAAGWAVAVSRDRGHSMGKANRESIRLLEGLGVEGDAHLGRRVQHLARVRRDPDQPNLRQVHLIHGELLDELQEGGIEVAPGEMGENITTRGIDLLNLPTGCLLRIGETAVVEVTGLRDPCAQLDLIQPGLMAATLDRDDSGRLVRKAGVMGVVVASGDVALGDSVRVELPPAPHQRLEPV